MSEKNGLIIIRENVANLEENYKNRTEIVVDPSMITPCRILNRTIRMYRMPQFVEQPAEKVAYQDDGVKVIAFSGGKVSLACALRYKDAGHKIVLFHVLKRGGDVSRIKKISEMLDAPLYVYDDMILDTPFRGMRILELATEYAVGHKHSPRIVFGYFDEAIAEGNSKYDWMYCKEFIDGYKELAQKYIDGFSILNPIPNYAIMWEEILSHKMYIPYLEYRDETEEKIFQNIRMDYRIDTPNLDLYLSNIEYLKHRKKVKKASLNDVWNMYFFYRIENSLFYREMMERFVSTI